MTATIVTTVEVLFDGSTATDISSRVQNVQINYGRQRIEFVPQEVDFQRQV